MKKHRFLRAGALGLILVLAGLASCSKRDDESSAGGAGEGTTFSGEAAGGQGGLYQGGDKADKNRVYKIGETGPAGGIVFYDKGDYADDWRYFETAPAHTEFKANWKNARTRCEVLIINGVGGWHLPPREVLELMYYNLKVNGVGGFSDDWYWSFTERNYGTGYCRDFSDGSSFDGGLKDFTYLVRAFRWF